MGKQEVLEILKEKLDFESKKESEEFLKNIDLAVEVLSKQLEIDKKAKLGNYIVVEKKSVEEKSGEINGVAYTKPAHNAIKIKSTKAIKDLEV